MVLGAPAVTPEPTAAQTPTSQPAIADSGPAQTVPDGLGNSLPRPNAGPDPDDAGDRGGWLQFALLAALVIASSVVLTRLLRSGRRNAD